MHQKAPVERSKRIVAETRYFIAKFEHKRAHFEKVAPLGPAIGNCIDHMMYVARDSRIAPRVVLLDNS